MITIYTTAYNEEIFLQFMIDHYRQRFPSCHIVVYDNYSTDNTESIAIHNNCEVIKHDTNEQVNDQLLTNLKNNCWKNAKTEWVLVCDVDELLNINESQLKLEDEAGTTIIAPTGYNMVNMQDNFDFVNIKYGCRHSGFDKKCLFKRTAVQEINYLPGAHLCNPVGNIKYSGSYDLYHYKGYNIDYLVERHKLIAGRISDINKANGWAHNYFQKSAEEKREFLLDIRKNSIKIIE